MFPALSSVPSVSPWVASPTSWPQASPWPLALAPALSGVQPSALVPCLSVTTEATGDAPVITYTLQALQLKPIAHQTRRVVSAQGWSYKTTWQGVLLKHVLDDANLLGHTKGYLVQSNAAGQHLAIPLAWWVAQPETLIVLAAEGHPLSPWQGGALRLLSAEGQWDYGLPALTTLSLLSTPPQGATVVDKPTASLPKGTKLYGFDCRDVKTINKPSDLKGW